MGWLGDIGKRFAGTDDYTKSIVNQNNAQAEYLEGLADSDEVANAGDIASAKATNSFLISSVIGVLIVGGAVTYFVTKGK